MGILNKYQVASIRYQDLSNLDIRYQLITSWGNMGYRLFTSIEYFLRVLILTILYSILLTISYNIVKKC